MSAARWVTADGQTVVDHVTLTTPAGTTQWLRARTNGVLIAAVRSVGDLRAQLGDDIVNGLREVTA